MKSHKTQVTHAYPKTVSIDTDGLASCPHCDHPIPPEHVDHQRETMACHNCRRFVDIHRVALPPTRDMLPVPQHVDVIDTEESLDIRYSAFKTTSKAKLIFLSIFTIMWVGFLAMFISTAGSTTEVIEILPFMSLHLLAGAGLLIWLVATLLNHTDIIVDDQAISVRTRPIYNPFRKDVHFDPSDIDQLYVQRYVSSRSNGSPNYAYKTFAIRRDGRKVTLLSHSNIDLCLYLEKSIERRLGIVDQKVVGEV